MQDRPVKIHRLGHLMQRHYRRVGAVTITVIGLLILFLLSIIFFPTSQYTEEPTLQQAPEIPLASQNQKVTLSTTIIIPDNLRQITIKHGESLSLIFDRLHINPQQLLQIAKLPLVKKTIQYLQAGQTIDFVIDKKHQLKSLTIPLNSSEKLIIKHTAQGFSAAKHAYELNIATRKVSATITSSFYKAGANANIPQKILVDLVNIYSWLINFKHSLRKGDHFTVLYELVKNMQTQKTEPGNVLATTFTHNSRVYYAIRYRDRYGRIGYYNRNGQSLRKAFRRKPVNIGYISSPFNLHRHHPILGIIRPHTGTDFAAPYGTPIHATGDGRIIYRARRGGYGRCIVINHGNGITTLYGHMSRFNKKLKLGSYVKMNQAIGYVGSSGMSTGPHVHYEYRINHHYKNPMTVKLPNTAPISKSKRAAFQTYATKEIKILTSSDTALT